MTNAIRKNAPRRMEVAHLRNVLEGVTDYNDRIYTAATWYASSGFMIVPFCDFGGGKTGYPKGLSQRSATCNLQKIEEWWHPQSGLYKGAAIAMAHGGKSGFCAVDLDVKSSVDQKTKQLTRVDGIGTLTDLIYMYGGYDTLDDADIKTLMAITPSGGRHLVFRFHPEVISNSEIHYAGIDTRGGFKSDPTENGGITFVEPSRKPGSTTTDEYKWDVEGYFDIIDIPQWLVDTLKGRPPTFREVRLQDKYRQSAPGLHGDGRDRNIYMDLLRFVGVGYTEEQLWDLVPDILARMDPPDERMVRAKIESVLQSDAFKASRERQNVKLKVDSLRLAKSEKGAILRTASNLDTILRSPLFEYEYGDIEYDEFHHHFLCNKKPMAMVADYAQGISVWISRNLNVEFSADNIRKAVEYIAYSKPHANAAREYMMRCPASTEHSIDDYYRSGRKGPGPVFNILCTQVLDLDNRFLHESYDDFNREAYRAQLWFWLQGVVARACVPGCKMEMVLNIFGQQGIGKSTFFKSLCPDPRWFTDSIKDAVVEASDNKDELKKLHGTLIAELPELSPIKAKGKSSDEKFKQFVSNQVDKFRAPYGKDTVDYKRTCALAGTSNNRDVYRDITGDRRFLSIDHGSVPIKLGDKNNGVIDQIRDALWGEVRSSFRPGELDQPDTELLVCLPEALRERQSIINSAHRYQDIGQQEIKDWVSVRTRFTYSEIVDFARTIPGMRDEREHKIIWVARSVLASDDRYHLIKRGTRHDISGNKEICNFWTNREHPVEKTMRPGMAAPPHWSKIIPNEVEDNFPSVEEY